MNDWTICCSDWDNENQAYYNMQAEDADAALDQAVSLFRERRALTEDHAVHSWVIMGKHEPQYFVE